MYLFKQLFKNKVYFFGDSHISVWANQNKIIRYKKSRYFSNVLNKLFIIRHTGPDLAYNLITKLDLIQEIKKIKKGSTILFCYGEIDCRVHLPIRKNLNDCIARYLQFINLFTDNYTIIVVTPFPTTKSEVSDKDYPTAGTHSERNQITKMFNEILCSEALLKNFKTLSIYNELTQNNITNMEYYMDEIHLSNKALPILLSKLEKKL